MDAFVNFGGLMYVESQFSVAKMKHKGKSVVFLTFGELRKTYG